MFAFLSKFIPGLSPIMMYMAIAMVVMCLGFLGYFKYSQHALQEYSKQIGQYQMAVNSQKSVIKQLQQDSEAIKKTNQDLQKTTDLDNDRANKLALTLTKLEQSAILNPALVEQAINRATAERIRCIELVTGASPLKKEVNRTCPQLVK